MPWWPVLWLWSCGGRAPEGTPEPAWEPDVWCPGGPGCATADGPLEVGVAVRSVVPECFEAWVDDDDNAVYEPAVEAFLDCGCDRLCPGDPGYPGPDAGEGDGQFQAVWMAGFQNGRAATGVRGAGVGLRGEGDGLWARAVVLRQGQTAVGLVTLDAVGWMYDDVRAFRQAVRDAGVDLDHLVIHSSHVHEGPDTMGIWGPSLTRTGYDPAYAEQTARTVAEAVAEAWAGLTEVTMEVGVVDATDRWDNGIANLINDTRDPRIVDPRVGAVRFADAAGDTVATLVHFANHPETVADDNTLITSDYVHALRETVEDGVTWDGTSRPGVGGTALYINGAVGGMMTSLGAAVVDPDGAQRTSASFDKADAVGQLLGELALDALADARPVQPHLAVRAHSFYLPVVNQGFHAMFQLGVFGNREIYHYDPDAVIDVDNPPDVRTEVDVVDIGPVRMLTIPGELLPELAIGGYDGAFTPPGVDIVDPGNPLPPDLSQAPEGPYLHDLMGAEVNWIVGLGNDELGYIIPPYNFVLDEEVPWLFEADGDHYEETNSLGPDTAPLIADEVARLLAWAP